ncbi:MAG: DNA cytosine methyltransferase [Phycicoccus sp.]
MTQPPVAAEFFAGVGLVRMGLEQAGFRVAWANDLDGDKRRMYAGHFGDGYELRDVATVRAADLPAGLGLAWASFPCTDLSLAGRRDGLNGSSSATFWHFTRIVDELGPRRPPVVALENVAGLATSHGGLDLAAAITELNRLGYSVDVLALDARRFVPQSRPRLFLVGALDAPADATHDGPDPLRPAYLDAAFADRRLRTHRAALPEPPPVRSDGLADVLDRAAVWWDADRAARFVASLSPVQHARLAAVRAASTRTVRTAYRRTRGGVARWEMRADAISGCLRTTRGGSSRQAVVAAGRGRARVRWMTAREYARLMGADAYRLDGIRENQALFGFGDAVCVPAVAWLAQHYLLPLIVRGG